MKKKHLTIVVLATLCLITALSIMPLSVSVIPYDPWADVSGPTQGTEDGTINMRDISYLIQMFGTSGNTTKDVNVTNWPSMDENRTLSVKPINSYYELDNSWPGVTIPPGKNATWITDTRWHGKIRFWACLTTAGRARVQVMPYCGYGELPPSYGTYDLAAPWASNWLEQEVRSSAVNITIINLSLTPEAINVRYYLYLNN